MNSKRILTAASVVVLVALTGACSNNKATTASSASAVNKEYQSKLRALEEREAALMAKEQSLASQSSVVQEAPAAPAHAMTASGDTLLPPNAKPGECYARIWLPPKFKTITEKVLSKAEGERLEIIPAKYQWGSEKVLVSEASEKLVGVPATYGTTSDRMLVQEEDTFWTFGTGGVKSAKGANGKRADANRLNIARTSGVPESASVGQCFAEYYKPAKFGTTTEKVLKSEATQKVQVIPAKYGTVTEKILVREASEKLVQVPAQYKNVTEKVLVKPAHTTWKVSECSGGACFADGQPVNKVSGSRDRIDHATGEIMCLVEVPAQYKTVTKRVMVTPPTTKRTAIPEQYKTVTVRKMTAPPQEKILETPETYQTVTKRSKVQDSATYWCEVAGRGGSGSCSAGSGGRATGDAFCLNSTPAKYKTITKRVLKTPAGTKRIAIPAQYKSVKVRKLVQPAAEKRIAIPAKYQTVTRREQTAEGQMEWRTVLCAANMTRGKIMEIQKALKAQGHYRGPIDGVVGSLTIKAMNSFQGKKGLTVSRFLTTQTVEALGVNPR